VSDSIRNKLYVEKYKPQTIDDVLLEPHLKKKFKEYIENKDVPTLLMHSPPRTGKTSCAKLIAEGITEDWMFINASSETSIDVIRTKVEPFCVTQSLESDLKIVVMDEVDGSSMNFQYALKENIEKFYNSTRFIFTSNNPHNIDPAIRSRCQEFEFGNINKKTIAKRLIEILKAEDTKFTLENVTNIIKGIGTDMRKLLNELQRLTITSGEGKILEKFVSTSDKHCKVLEMIKNKELTAIRKYISEEGVNYDGLLKFMLNNASKISASNWAQVMIDISDVSYRMKVGVDNDIAFSAGLVTIMENM
jgi:DNA polymerase III delta prime subunit